MRSGRHGDYRAFGAFGSLGVAVLRPSSEPEYLRKTPPLNSLYEDALAWSSRLRYSICTSMPDRPRKVISIPDPRPACSSSYSCANAEKSSLEYATHRCTLREWCQLSRDPRAQLVVRVIAQVRDQRLFVEMIEPNLALRIGFACSGSRTPRSRPLVAKRSPGMC